MDMPAEPLNTDSPYIKGRTNLAALFDSSAQAESALQSLAAAGFSSSEISSAQQGDKTLVTVTHPDRLTEAAVILQQQGGSLPDGDTMNYDKIQEAIQADAEKAPNAEIPPDSGLSEHIGTKKVGGGVFTRGSISGGSGGGTATGGSLFGSSR